METEATVAGDTVTDEAPTNVVIEETKANQIQPTEETMEIVTDEQLLLQPGAVFELADGQNAAFTLQEFIHYHIEETKLNRSFMDFYARIYSIQHKRAEVLAHIYEDFFKQDKSFKYREIIEDLNEDLNTLIVESPQNYELITNDINVDLVLGENNQFRFVEDNGVIISENQRRLAKSKAATQNKGTKHRLGSDNPVVSISLSCPACGIECESSSILHNHIQDIHFDNPLVICNHDDCEETFYIQNIKDHEEDYHPELGEICELCNTTFRSKSLLLEHVKEHMMGNASFHCDFPNCSFSHSNPTKMVEHKSSVHRVHLKKFFRCPVSSCGKSFPDNPSFQSHIAIHGDKVDTYKFACNVRGCNASFRRRRHLEEHKEKHAGKDDTEIVEEEENDENLNYSTDMEYMDTYNEDKGSFDRNYSGSAELYEVRESVDEEGNHQREVFLCVNKGLANETVHPISNAPGVSDFLCGEKTLTNSCDLCNLNFEKMEEMVTHLKTRHHQYTIKGYRCDQCTYVTHFRSLLGKHKNSVHGGKYKCEYCGKLSKDSGNHNRHRNIHRNIVYRCSVENCTAIYKSLKAFNVHLLSHSNTQPVYNCDYPGCKYTSHYHNAVNVHKLTHTDQRNYVCPWDNCKKGFKRNGDLNKHVNHSHKGEKRSYKSKKLKTTDSPILYRCTGGGCGFTTGDPVELQEHEETVHGEPVVEESNERNIKLEYDEQGH